MASTIPVPSLPAIQTNPAEQAKQLVAVATAASTDITAAQAGTSIIGINGTSVPATPAKGAVLQATSTTTAAWTVLYAVLPVITIAVANQATKSGLAQTIDGVALSSAGMRVYLAAQTTPEENGLWVTAAGAWTRPADWATGATIPLGTIIRVATGGTANFDAFGGEWMVTATGVVDTDTITALPRICKGQQALSSGTPSTATVSSLWIKSATKSSVSLAEVTNQANNTLKGVLVAGAGSGTLTITGANTNTDTISYCVVNW